jgi:hypothetical protein
MSHSTRASQVQRLLAQDSIKLGEYRALHRDAPLRFQLVQSAAELKQGELEACLKLVEHTSGDDYKASSVGWKVKNKLVEMGDVEMMYLLVRQADGDPRHAEVAKEDRKDTTEELKSSATSKNEGMVHQRASLKDGALMLILLTIAQTTLHHATMARYSASCHSCSRTMTLLTRTAKLPTCTKFTF